MLRAKLILTIGTFVLGFAAPVLADPEHGGGPTGEKGRPADKAHEEKGKPAGVGHEGKGKPERTDGKDKADKDKNDEREKGSKGDEHNPAAPPGLEAKSDEHHKKLLERFEERRKTMKDRAKSERDDSRRRLGPLLNNQAVQQELRRHTMTVARLQRIKEIGDADEKADLSSRAAAALEKENARHAKRIAALAAQGSPAGSASGSAS
jgi:hypothetical protein